MRLIVYLSDTNPVWTRSLTAKENFVMKISFTKSLLLTLLVYFAFCGNAGAGDFSYPQGVYSGEQIKLTEYPNGGVFNANLLDRIRESWWHRMCFRGITLVLTNAGRDGVPANLLSTGTATAETIGAGNE